MYPGLILIIVNKERSIVNTFGFSTVIGNKVDREGHADSAEYRPATAGNLVFANKSTIVDNEQSLSTGHFGDSKVRRESGDSC